MTDVQKPNQEVRPHPRAAPLEQDVAGWTVPIDVPGHGLLVLLPS